MTIALWTAAQVATLLTVSNVSDAQVAQQLDRTPGEVADLRSGLHAFHTGATPCTPVTLTAHVRAYLDAQQEGWRCPRCGTVCGDGRL
jgi:uncharacterized paraquat-inducible protein A